VVGDGTLMNLARAWRICLTAHTMFASITRLLTPPRAAAAFLPPVSASSHVIAMLFVALPQASRMARR
jgi:hypothetical protein